MAGCLKNLAAPVRRLLIIFCLQRCGSKGVWLTAV